MKPHKNGNQKWAFQEWIAETKKWMEHALHQPAKRLISDKWISKKKESNGKISP